jgi:hypothetical protein
MIQQKDNSLVKEFQKVLLDDKEFLKNLLAERLQCILQDDQDYFINMEIGSGLQMTYNSTVYDIKFLSFTPREVGSKLKIERIEKET